MTEVKATDSTGMSGALQQEILGFVHELKTFRNDIHTKIKQQDERMTQLDRKTARHNRTPLSTGAEVVAPHQKAFNAYLRHGDDDALRGIVVEEKGMTTVSDGGFLAAPEVAAQVQEGLAVKVSLRAVANVVAVESSAYEVLVDQGDIASGWATEETMTETASPTVERVVIPVHELSAMPKASQRLLDDAAFDIETWLAGRIAEKFARAEASAFINGDGVDKPRGLLNYPMAPWQTSAANEIGLVRSGVDGDFNPDSPASTLIDLVYALSAEYRANASFLMNSKTAAAVRKMRDTEGRFLWADSLAADQFAQLLGYPVIISEDMPDIDGGSLSIAFGDFQAGYTIVERPDLRVLRDPFSAKPHVLFYATKRVGGGLTDARAIKIMQFA